jgi:hypothetical protein
MFGQKNQEKVGSHVWYYFRGEGAQGFFKGMLYPLLSSGAINSLFFGFYGATLNQLPVIFTKPSYTSKVRVTGKVLRKLPLNTS